MNKDMAQSLITSYPISWDVQTGTCYPAGFVDVMSFDKIRENFCLTCDTKGHFAVHCIIPEEAKYKLCKVRKILVGTKGILHCVTHDAPTIGYPHTLIKVKGTIPTDLEAGKVTDITTSDTNSLCMVPGDATLGRTGVVTNRERHPGSFDVVDINDANGSSFATQLANIFTGKGNKPWTSLHQGRGICLTFAEERDGRRAARQSSG
ncbi:small ribosomal subunit protein eS4, X isoform-like [Oryctolagus cuniculus]|uniref:small ribosomal subunit protein eS4, X isoform-like n=1 Tax=Oryctolagus cuniculus TaxID=9986 RepID=UPI003879223E